MTVGELIEDLQKQPAHWRVFVEHPDFSQEVRHDGFGTEIASVADIRGTGDCCVVIDATEGVK